MVRHQPAGQDGDQHREAGEVRPRVAVPAAELDKHPHLLGVANRVVDLTTGDLLPPDPELRITRVAGCEYDPAARCPPFERTVADVFNDDQETVEFFQRLTGYTFNG